MKKKIIFIVAVIIFVASACNVASQGPHYAIKQVSYDTVRASEFAEIKGENDTCLSIANRFFNRFGIVISKYYIIKDSLAIDLNNDNFIDTIVILSPLSLEPVDNPCRIDGSPKRLLVEIINYNGKAKIRNVYANLVSDIGGVLSHYNGMLKTNGGFKIVHQAGARYSWLYSMEFSTGNKDQLTLEKISKICSFNGNDKSVDYYYNHLTLDKMNFIDTLKVQCNCDQLWKELEKQ